MSELVMDITWLRSVTLSEFKAALKDPASQGPVSKLLRTPEGAAIAAEMINDPNYVPVSKRVAPSVEEMAQIVADNARADEAAVLDAAAPTSEEAAAALVTAAEPAVVAPVEPVRVKIIRDYQVKDESGNPIGRPTHLEAWTPEEMYAKYEAAHINAVRYAERIKKSRVVDVEGSTKKVQAEQAAFQSEAEAAIAVEVASKDPSKLKDAISKVSKADREAEIARDTARMHGRIVAEAWMADHKEDFLPCDANRIIIGDWLKANNRELSYDNLELAFAANASRLAKPEYSAPEETPAAPAANPPAVAPAVAVAATPAIPVPAAATAVSESTATVTAPQPASTATVSTPVAATNTPAARRPGVNASLPPGSLSAQRPSESVISVASTRDQMLQEIKKMPRGEFGKKLKDANYVKRLKAAGIEVVGSRT